MSAFLFVFGHPGHNTLGPGLPSGASAGQWESEEGRGPCGDWLDAPRWDGEYGVRTSRLRVHMRSKGLKQVKGIEAPELPGQTVQCECPSSFPIQC
jgi:hypothetical protein